MSLNGPRGIRQRLGLFGGRIESDFGSETGRETKNVAAVQSVFECRSHTFKEFQRRRVLLGPYKMHIQPVYPAGTADFPKVSQHSVFDTTAEGAATQQE